MSKKLGNTIELYGLAATISPFIDKNSSSRAVMVSSHLAQAITPKESALSSNLTGLEMQLASAVFNIQIEAEGQVQVHSIQHKYHKGIGKGSIRDNPVSNIVYRCQTTGIFDVVELHEYDSNHKIFGTKLKIMPIVSSIAPGTMLPGGTILAQSPNVKPCGQYSTSIAAEVAFVSTPATIEDGFEISESFADRAEPLQMSSSVTSVGRTTYPLHIYGDPNSVEDYRPFADIGDKIRDDGLVYAAREYNPIFDPIDMTRKHLVKVDMVHDHRTYGIAGAIVYDVQVESGVGESKNKQVMPSGMDSQYHKYIDALHFYYDGILNMQKSLPKNAVLGPKLHKLITRAVADRPNANRGKAGNGGTGIIRRTYKKVPLDEFRVEVKYHKRLTVGKGAKLSQHSAGKGVICRVTPDNTMPVDSAGNVADILIFSKSVTARLNPGIVFDQYIGACSRDMTKWVRANLHKLPDNIIWDRLMEYYSVTAPLQHKLMLENYLDNISIRNHLESIANDKIYLNNSPAETHNNVTIVEKVERIIKPTYGPVSYIDVNGQHVTTKDPVLIGPVNMLLLEKTEQNPMAASSAPLQHHGLPSGPHRTGRLSHPSKLQPVKALGETETRLFAANAGPDTASELLDLSGNPDSHRLAVERIITSDKPMNITRIINRVEHPKGKGRAIGFVKHVLTCVGIEL